MIKPGEGARWWGAALGGGRGGKKALKAGYLFRYFLVATSEPNVDPRP